MGKDALSAAKERRAHRREFDPEDAVERLDKRGTRTARYKVKPVRVYMSEETLAICDAVRSRLNYGAGMTRSAFITWLIRRYTSGKEAKEYQRDWVEQQKERVQDESVQGSR